MEYIEYTSTQYRVQKYDWVVTELLDFVYRAKTEEQAVFNIEKCLTEYKKSLSFWELLKLILNKL